MAFEIFPLFRDYSLVVRDWLRQIHLPRFDRVQRNIKSMTINGTTGGGTNQSEIEIIPTSEPNPFVAGHPIHITGTLDNDEYYTILNVVGNVLILDPNYRRLKASQVIVRGQVQRVINVVYANFERAVASIVQPLRNGKIDSPAISYYISDYQLTFEKTRPAENYDIRQYKDNNTGGIVSVAKVPPLLEYQVHYVVNMWAVYQQEMDILQYQSVSEFNPQKFFWVGDPAYGMNYTGNRMDRQYHGQWAQCIVDNFADVSDLEPGDTQPRTLRFELSFTIMNAFLPQPFDDQQPMIGAIDIESLPVDSGDMVPGDP
jgi:hypothetical protein